jgi:hypothetical protein
MFGGLNRLLAAAVLVGAVLVLPPAALADCGGNASAVNVYKECLSSGGGGKATSGSNSTSGTHTTGSTSVPVSAQTQEELKKAGADGQSLSNLVRRYGVARHLQAISSGPGTEPTAVGSAFDLGSGPTALLIVLALTAVLLLGATGFRSVRQRRH